MEFKHQKYFTEGKNVAQTIKDFKNACDNDMAPQWGVKRASGKYIKGYCLSYYHGYDLVWEPITFHLSKKSHSVDYDAMNMSKEKQSYHIRLKNNPYVVLDNFCYVFSDGHQQHEFYFDEKTPFTEKSRQQFIEKINELFFVQPLFHELENSLEEKSEKTKKPKI